MDAEDLLKSDETWISDNDRELRATGGGIEPPYVAASMVEYDVTECWPFETSKQKNEFFIDIITSHRLYKVAKHGC